VADPLRTQGGRKASEPKLGSSIALP
jgi:hypothetical protein